MHTCSDCGRRLFKGEVEASLLRGAFHCDGCWQRPIRRFGMLLGRIAQDVRRELFPEGLSAISVERPAGRVRDPRRLGISYPMVDFRSTVVTLLPQVVPAHG